VHHTVDFSDDLRKLQTYVTSRLMPARAAPGPIGLIAVGFKLCQRGFVGMNFDTRDEYSFDVSRALGDPLLKMPHWSRAYMQADRYGISVVRLDGTRKAIKPGAGDAAVAAEFGNTLLSVVRDAKGKGLFKPLPLRNDCRLDVLEFDFMWAWTATKKNPGSNLLRRLRAIRCRE
jgi:hypothetical protein